MAVSFLMLFLELAMIRWLPATIRITAYFSNVVLVSCFLGMGVGCLLKARRSYLVAVAPLLLLLVGLAIPLGRAGVANPYASHEFVFGPGGRLSWTWVLPLVFGLNALVFVGIGQRIARLMDEHRPLVGYSLNVVGSLLGSLAAAAVAVFRLPPAFWFAASGLVLLWLLRARRGELAAAAVLIAFAVAQTVHDGAGFVWSPYYKIALEPGRQDEGGGYFLTVNEDSHQRILDLSERAAARSRSVREWQDSYGLPYRLRGLATPCRVLVLGAGTGNDVAAALRESRCEVDAVELDPVIAEMGRDLHPERPYDDPRVRLVVADARAFLATATQRYDLVVLGWLDSHRLFSSLSNVRQDNFVYTREAMRQARDLLTDDGLLVLSFWVAKPWVGNKLYAMLAQAFGHPPVVYAQRSGGYGPSGQMFAVTRQTTAEPLPKVEGFLDRSAEHAQVSGVVAPTDEWPYLYYRDRTVSGEYLGALAVLLAISCALVLPVSRGADLGRREAVHFFLLGAGFLLLEVRNITSLALVFGSTWVVSAVAIAAVMLMTLGANALVARGVAQRRHHLAWLLLLASIGLALAWSRLGASGVTFATRAVLTTGAVSLTFILTGLVFARAFARTAAPGAALGANVLGAVVGGLAEYLSILVGISGLGMVAAAVYLAAWATAPVSASGVRPRDDAG